MKFKWRLWIGLFLLSGTAQLQAQEVKKHTWPYKIVRGLMNWVDSSAVRGKDPQYISIPEKAWAMELRTDLNNSYLDLVAKDHMIEGIDYWGSKTHSGPTMSVGAWLGYRGYGLGISKAIVGGGDIKALSLGAAGGNYGVNLRMKEYRSNTPKVRVKGKIGDEDYYEEMVWETEMPFNIRSLFLDAYYMFNRKRFSYAAAYDQSAKQLRSAGSLVAGAMFYTSQVAYENKENYLLISMMNGVGKLRFTQASIGAGYAYNWVPASGWMVNAMVVPMVTLRNRLKMYTYEVKYGDPEKGEESFILVPSGAHSYTNHIDLNADMRLSVSHQWQRSYVRVFSHFNHFRFRKENNHGHTSDWTVYGAFGYRF